MNPEKLYDMIEIRPDRDALKNITWDIIRFTNEEDLELFYDMLAALGVDPTLATLKDIKKIGHGIIMGRPLKEYISDMIQQFIQIRSKEGWLDSFDFGKTPLRTSRPGKKLI